MNMLAQPKRSAFAAAKAAMPKRADCIVEVPVNLWAEGRPNRPAAPVKVGLRILSEADIARARSVAESFATKMHRDLASQDVWEECYNAHLIAAVLYDATVHPANVDQRWFSRDAAVSMDLTTNGLQFLWDHYEMHRIASSTIAPEATDDEMLELADSLYAGDLFDGIDLERARRVRRLIKAAIAEAQASG